MVLIFGGAYQGMEEYAFENYGLKEEDICVLTEHASEFDFSNKAFSSVDQWIFRCVKEGVEAKDYIEKNWESFKDKVLIVTDISQGIVPMDKDERAWREMVGRTLMYLGKKSDEVVRVFCGIGQQIK